MVEHSSGCQEMRNQGNRKKERKRKRRKRELNEMIHVLMSMGYFTSNI